MTFRPIQGNNGELERITSFRIGGRTASTSSTSFTQPYSNEFRSVIPSTFLENSFGYQDTLISLSGRLHCVQSTGAATVRVYHGNEGGLPGTEVSSSTGANYQIFHTPTASYAQTADVLALDYQLKSSDGTEVQAYGDVYANFWGLMD